MALLLEFIKSMKTILCHKEGRMVDEFKKSAYLLPFRAIRPSLNTNLLFQIYRWSNQVVSKLQTYLDQSVNFNILT